MPYHVVNLSGGQRQLYWCLCCSAVRKRYEIEYICYQAEAQYKKWTFNSLWWLSLDLSPAQTRKHCCGNVMPPCFLILCLNDVVRNFAALLVAHAHWSGEMFLQLETRRQTRKHCFCNKNVSEFVGKHFYFLGRKFCFRSNVSRGGQTGKREQEGKCFRNNVS